MLTKEELEQINRFSKAELTAEQGWTMQEITDAATAALQAYFTTYILATISRATWL